MKLKYNPRNLKGFGMADGECCERLWSYLRRFSRITKECKPSHRIDMLTDALLYYGRMSADQLGNGLFIIILILNPPNLLYRNSATK